MLTEIAIKYNENIFLLCNGSLEDYIKIISGKRPEFEDVINFCNNPFGKWIVSNSNQEIKDELDYFFHSLTI